MAIATMYKSITIYYFKASLNLLKPYKNNLETSK